MREKVVVTGAAGFIGSHLCERLLGEGFEVVGVDALLHNYDIRFKRDNISALVGRDRFVFVEKALSEVDFDELLDGVGVVFHLAALAGVRSSWGKSFDEYVDSNIRATQTLCEALRSRPLGMLVYASSSSVYGETAKLPMKEDHPTRPVSPYGVTKLDGENLCLLYQRNHGIPTVCLRYFTVYGPRQRPDMAFHKFIRSALRGSPVDVYGTGAQTRDFTYIDDVVNANLAAMEYRGGASVFNIGGGSRVTLNRVLDLVGRVTGRELEVRFTERQHGDVTHTFADVSLAAAELGYAPTVALERGLQEEVEWLQSAYTRIEEGAQ
jgi:UDP-glucose 4-epimerase